MIFGFNTDVKYGTTVYHVQSEARVHEQLLQTQVFMKGRCIGKHAVSYADKVSEPGFSDEHMHQLLKDQHKRIVEAARAGRVEQKITHTTTTPAVAPAQANPAAAPPVTAEPSPAAASAEPKVTTAPQPVQALVEAVAVVATAPSPTPVEVTAPPAEEPAEASTQPTTVLRLTRSALSPSIAGDYSAPEQAAPIPFDFAPEEPEAPPGPRFTAEAVPAPAAGHGMSVDCMNPDAIYSDGVFRLNIQVSDEGQPVPGVQLTWRLSSGATKLTHAYVTSDPAGLAEIKFEHKDTDAPDLNVLVQASHRGKSVSRRFRFRKS